MEKEKSLFVAPRLMMKEKTRRPSIKPKTMKPMLLVKYCDVGFRPKVLMASLAGEVSPPW